MLSIVKSLSTRQVCHFNWRRIPLDFRIYTHYSGSISIEFISSFARALLQFPCFWTAEISLSRMRKLTKIDEALLPFLLNVDLSSVRSRVLHERHSVGRRSTFLCWFLCQSGTSLRCRWCFHIVVLRTTLEQHLARCEERLWRLWTGWFYVILTYFNYCSVNSFNVNHVILFGFWSFLAAQLRS